MLVMMMIYRVCDFLVWKLIIYTLIINLGKKICLREIISVFKLITTLLITVINNDLKP